ncbi:3945_t:CDS:2, partial [Paraglomus occultum]
ASTLHSLKRSYEYVIDNTGIICQQLIKRFEGDIQTKAQDLTRLIQSPIEHKSPVTSPQYTLNVNLLIGGNEAMMHTPVDALTKNLLGLFRNRLGGELPIEINRDKMI